MIPPRPIVRAQIGGIIWSVNGTLEKYAMKCADADGASFVFGQVPVVAGNITTNALLTVGNWSTQRQTLAQAFDTAMPWHTRFGLADVEASAEAVYVPMRSVRERIVTNARQWQGVGDPRLRFTTSPAVYYDVMLPNPYSASVNKGAPTQVLRHPVSRALWIVRGADLVEVSMQGVWNYNATLQTCTPAATRNASVQLADIRFAVVGARFGFNTSCISNLSDLGFVCTPAAGAAYECLLRGTRDVRGTLRALAVRVRDGSAFLMRPYAVVAAKTEATSASTTLMLWLTIAGSAILLVLCCIGCACVCFGCGSDSDYEPINAQRSHSNNRARTSTTPSASQKKAASS
jgi:hypothetical protein